MYCLLAHCCCSFSNSVRAAVSQGVGFSWGRETAGVQSMVGAEQNGQGNSGTCLWEEINFSFLFSYAWWASNILPHVIKELGTSWLVVYCVRHGLGDTKPSPKGVWWALGAPGQPAVLSHFSTDCGSCELENHTPACCLLPTLWILALEIADIWGEGGVGLNL